MNNLKNQQFYENVKNKFRVLNIIFSILSIISLFVYPIFAILTKRGNLYINISVIILSAIYAVFWIAFGNNKTYKINRIYKWLRLLLSAVSLGINIYSIYITMTNFSVISIIINIVMIIFWIINVTVNIFYEIALREFHKFMENNKEQIDALKEKISEKKTEFLSKRKTKLLEK